MPASTATSATAASWPVGDTIRILVATDNHVGFGERDPVRKDDSWRAFEECLRIAVEREADMVLLGGDLFHDNKPSRQALYQVMRSLRAHCLGERPCELEMLSDKTEVFEGAFNHANYEDPDINVSLPVFSIHGNHDDPAGEGHLASLDVLQMAGLVNYFGRAHESDSIAVKPLLLQKGRSKLALYGLSNVRDERLHRTFRDGGVKFFRPAKQPADWFNLLAVHQNRHAYTETGYLPENFLPSFVDLVLWGHEHECKIAPSLNPETNFHVLQPGSSVATSLVFGEAVAKHVALLSVSGRDFHVEPIRLKTVRPFVVREVVLAEDKAACKLAKMQDNRGALTKRLVEMVDEMIEQANAEWLAVQQQEEQDLSGSSEAQTPEPPLPLVRLRVEYSAPAEGGHFDCENPQRFSNRFVGRVANVHDVVQFHRRRQAGSRRGGAAAATAAEVPERSALASSALDTVKVEQLVAEFLSAQSLTILPQNSFGDAVAQFVDKDDKFAVENFLADSLKSQVDHLLSLDREDPDLEHEIDAERSRLEQLFRAGYQKEVQRRRANNRILSSDEDDEAAGAEEEASHVSASIPSGKGKGRAGIRGGAKVALSAGRARGTKLTRDHELDGGDDGDVAMDDGESDLFLPDSQAEPAPPPPTRSKQPATRTIRGGAAKGADSSQAKFTQTRLQMAPSQQPATTTTTRQTRGKKQTPVVLSDDDVEDSEDEAFEPAAPVSRRTR